MPVWEEDPETFMGLKCNFHPHCIFCKAPMELFDTKLLNFSLNDGTPDRNSHAIDVVVYCPECGLRTIFGVAISPEHAKKTLDNILELAKERGLVQKATAKT